MGQPAVFLDRDGTLIEEIGYPTRPQQIRILGGVARGLARLAEAGCKRIVVTNQSGIARGLMTEDDLDRFHEALDEQLDLLGAAVDAYYACPHHPDRSGSARPDLAIECDCRKPKPGLILQAAGDLDIDLGASWTIGDTWRDVQAGQAAGLRTIKLPAPPGHDAPRPADVPPPTAEAEDFEEAVALILGDKPCGYLAPGEHTGDTVYGAKKRCQEPFPGGRGRKGGRRRRNPRRKRRFRCGRISWQRVKTSLKTTVWHGRSCPAVPRRTAGQGPPCHTARVPARRDKLL